MEKASELKHEGMLGEDDFDIIRDQLIMHRRKAHNERYRLLGSLTNTQNRKILEEQFDVEGARERKNTRESSRDSTLDKVAIEMQAPDLACIPEGEDPWSAAVAPGAVPASPSLAPSIPVFKKTKTMPTMDKQLRLRPRSTLDEHYYQDNLSARHLKGRPNSPRLGPSVAGPALMARTASSLGR